MSPTGLWTVVEVPGPDSFEEWAGCWKVFENLLLGLALPQPVGDVFAIANLEVYFEHIRSLAIEFPDLWGLICRAEDRCRAEHFPRLRRRLELARAQGLCPEFDPARPWDYVFRAAADDDKFWNREVRHPALHVIAQSSRGAGHTQAAVAAATALADVQTGAPLHAKRRPPAAASAAAGVEADVKRRKQAEGIQGVPAAVADARPARGGDGGRRKQGGGAGGDKSASKAKQHPTKRCGRFITTREGTEICFKFQKNTCETTCPAGRAHVCQLCLGGHPGAHCAGASSSGGAGAARR